MPSSLAAHYPVQIEAGNAVERPRQAVDWLTAERDRWLLWLPVLVGAGIGVYFALHREPPLWLGLGLSAVPAVAMIATVLAGPHHPRLTASQPALLAALALAAGFTAAQIHANVLQTRMLPRPVGPATVSGRVLRVEIFPDGPRLTLDRLRVSRLSVDETPQRARLRLRGQQPSIAPGSQVAVRAMLVPPPAPAVPGGFDYQRQAFFEGLGAVGYSVGTAVVLDAEPEGGKDAAADAAAPWTGIGVWFARLRQIVNGRVAAHLDGPAAAVTMALLTGEQRAIPDAEMAAIRDSGLAHLLSISGLHIGLVAGFVFLVFRGMLALMPPLALRFPIKKWAAVVSLLAAGAYTLLADAPVPSQRSFLMIAVVLLAMLVDRQGISLRLVAVAAMVVLLTQPAAMLGPSFQMSFAAVVALISAYEALRERRRQPREHPAPGVRAALYLGGIVLSTMIAGTATAPFAAYHFNRFQVYSVAANMLAIPVTSFWIMPSAAVALLAMPFGLDGPALTAMSWGVDVVIWVARTVAAWPGAVVLLPPMPTWGLALITVGGLWLCLWRRRWRLLGIVPMVTGAAAMLLVQVPDVFIDGAGKLMAVRSADGGLILSSRIAGRSARDAWLRRAGERAAAGYWPKPGSAASDTLSCDSVGCVFRAQADQKSDRPESAHLVAFARRGEALAEDCRRAQVVVSLVPVRRRCPSAEAVIDRFDLWRNGAHAIWLGVDGVRVASVNGLRGDRPWVLRPQPAALAKGADLRQRTPLGGDRSPRASSSSLEQERDRGAPSGGSGSGSARRRAAVDANPAGETPSGADDEETSPGADEDPDSDPDAGGDAQAQ